jgi:integrase
MAGQVRALRGADRTLRAAVDAFLDQTGLASTTRRSYALTLTRLSAALDPDRLLVDLDADELTAAIEALWATSGPATWNRNLACVRSFLGFTRRQGWPTADLLVYADRRHEPIDRTKAIPPAALERLWRRDDVALRDKTLWRLLYETAGRANEVLALNVEDLDLPNKRARIRRKGGDVDLLHFQTGSARLLPRLIGKRPSGPLFLTDRRPVPARRPANADICPTTGRARLSYSRAERLFKTATGGWTLHQLRHTALTQLAEHGVSLPLLQAKSGHQSLRSLQRYARPGPEAVAKLTADTDPARRR